MHCVLYMHTKEPCLISRTGSSDFRIGSIDDLPMHLDTIVRAHVSASITSERSKWSVLPGIFLMNHKYSLHESFPMVC